MTRAILGIPWVLLYVPALLTWATAPLLSTLGRCPAWMATVRNEVHPFIPALILIDLVNRTWGRSALEAGPTAYPLAVLLLIFWAIKHGDDDRWKRRRRKLSAKIARRGARLAVVPVGTR